MTLFLNIRCNKAIYEYTQNLIGTEIAFYINKSKNMKLLPPFTFMK